MMCEAMDIKKTTVFDTRLQMSNDRIVYRNLALFISSCWFHLADCIFFLIKFIARHVFRSKMEDGSQKAMNDFSVSLELMREANEIEERDFNEFGEEEEEEEDESSNFSFKFEYQIPKVSAVSNEDFSVPATEENYQVKTTNISNYRFSSERNFSGFVEELKPVTLKVHESFIGVGDSEEMLESKFLSALNFENPSIQSQDVVFLKDEKLEKKIPIVSETKPMSEKEVTERFSGFNPDSAGDFEKDEKLGEKIPVISETYSGFDSDSAGDFQKSSMQFQDLMFLKIQKLEGKRPIGFETNSVGEKEITESFSGFDSDSDSISLSDGYSVKNLVVDSESDGFLSERDFGDKESLIESSTFEMELMEDMEKIEGGQCSNSSGGFSDVNNQIDSGIIYDGFLSERGFNEPEKISEENIHENYSPYTDKLSQLDEVWSDNDSVEPKLELKELDEGEINERQLPGLSKVQMELMDSSDDELHHSRNGSNLADPEFSSSPINDLKKDTEGCEKRTREEDVKKSEEFKLQDDLDDEDLDALESLWEHQDLIEQLKMELKRVRVIGLPTIFEESESPRTIEDLKPWKIDEKFMREDPMDELHKFYKSYRERMRKFDILNYQKMYAIGFLQLKNPLELMRSHKPLIPTIISSFHHKSSTDPSERFMRELQVALETVYVGQTCLSWEFLRWQYEKARELPDSDPHRSHQYNQVAGEFQQFQVIVQRFIENESFQGPRLQNYVKNRCVLRNLLQVPFIKEDCLKDKMEEKSNGNYYAITSEMLEDIMEESIRIFWEFVKRDKVETSIILKSLMRNQVELQDPSDLKLMSEIQASLQKKEKRLNDILKTGNCLVKKFKKPREDRSNQDLFFSQIDMKLVSRVLKMSKITSEQLVWCHKKLSKITFSDRKIHREPSFLLFPC